MTDEAYNLSAALKPLISSINLKNRERFFRRARKKQATAERVACLCQDVG